MKMWATCYMNLICRTYKLNDSPILKTDIHLTKLYLFTYRLRFNFENHFFLHFSSFHFNTVFKIADIWNLQKPCLVAFLIYFGATQFFVDFFQIFICMYMYFHFIPKPNSYWGGGGGVIIWWGPFWMTIYNKTTGFFLTHTISDNFKLYTGCNLFKNDHIYPLHLYICPFFFY